MTEIILKKIEGSTNIKEVGYDEKNQTLAVVFLKSNVAYHYYGVPPDVYNRFLSAKSMGSFFHQEIRSNFTARRQEDVHEG